LFFEFYAGDFFPAMLFMELNSPTNGQCAIARSGGFVQTSRVMFWKLIQLGALAALCGLAWSGCSPAGSVVTDEKREPHFLIGLSRITAVDYEGAIEAFQQALEGNPKSAAAHFQLGCLYANQVPDPAAAIYHYEQFLRRQPLDPNAEMIRKQIPGLKASLAMSVLHMPPVSGLQKQVESLKEENRRLQLDLTRMREEWVSRQSFTNPPSVRIAGGAMAAGKQPPTANRSLGARAGVRTHTVVPGDTPTSIARRYAVSVESLLKVNPGLNPKRMRVNQNLTVPTQ
jgi:tetratricopeptide (TPR) repeat protein